jgi:3'-5' exoribonuclease
MNGTAVKSKYITELQVRDQLFNEPFLLRDVQRRFTKDNRPYLLCVFSDNSGEMNGVFWDVPEYIDTWAAAGQAVLVTGQIVSFRDALQINTSDLNRWLAPDMGLFLPASRRAQAEMVAELRAHVDSLAQPWRRLVAHILLDPAFLPAFAASPAARTMHHAYVGGLLEHTLSMAALADLLANHYQMVDRDLLLAGALLHDAGKVSEYNVSSNFTYSDDGRLVGHILRAVIMVEQAAAELGDIEAGQLRELVHLVASHHGKLEWGSPVAPKTLEAVLLHQIDLLDSRTQGFLDHVRADAGDEQWTTKASPMFQAELRRPKKS